jgi:TonB family protein
MSSALQQAPEQTFSITDRPANDARPSESLVALTHDEVLRETLTAVAPEHVLSFATDEADLTHHLRAEPAGVAFLDSAALTVPAAELTERLRAQFPDLVLIVAGGPEDQSALSHQVTSGTVYRFLHKPVSAQRVKLFVDAAWRRHDVEHAATGTFATVKLESPLKRSLSRHAPWLGLTALALVLAAGLTFVLRLHGAAGPGASQSASSAAGVAGLLTRADAALASGALIAPPTENAADLYRQVLKQDAANSRAREGLQRVADGLLTSAERAFLDGHLDEARQLTQAARAIEPDNVRIEFLTAQIAKETAGGPSGPTDAGTTRDRANHAGRASRTLAGSTPGGAPSASASTRAGADRLDVGGRVSGFLRQAESRMRSGALLAPAENNAKFFVDAAAALAPDDAAVHKAQRALAERMLTEAQSAVQGGDLSEADRWAQAASDAGAPAPEVASVRRALQNAQGAATAATVARLATLFNQRLQQDRLLSPPTDSARFYLAEMEAADPTSPSTAQARTALAGRLLDEARHALTTKDWAAAQDLLAEARAAGVSATDAGAVEEAITAAHDQSRSASILPETTLRKVRNVAPVYPFVAEQLGRSGVVEMQFTVETDGSVGDIQVVHADPPGMFNAAAIAAVRQWRYQPVKHDGQLVTQRVAVRVLFKP